MSLLGTTFRITAWAALAATAFGLGLMKPWRGRDFRGLGAVSVLRDRTYRVDGTRRAKVDVYAPEGPAHGPGNHLPGRHLRRPAVLAIHGGSWVGGSKTDYGPQLARLAERGCVVFAVDYTLARPGAPGWPEVIADLREAVRWIRRNADEFHVDPNRLAAIGSGAGGHLAMLLGTLPGETLPDDVSARVQAVVNLYGPSDLETLARLRHLTNDPVRLLLGGRSAESADRARAASPINLVTGNAPPMLLIHGSGDAWVPVEQSQRFSETLAAAGVMHRLIVVSGAGTDSSWK